MYNTEQKNRYLNNCKYEKPTVDLLIKIFNSTQIVEEQLEKDLSEFNQIEVSELLKSFNSKSSRRLQSNCVFFNDYYVWCLQEGLVTNIINPYENSVVEKIIDNIIPKEKELEYRNYFTKSELLEYVNKVDDLRDKFILYAKYCGLKDEELFKLRVDDLDMSTHTINLVTGRIIKVDDLFINLMYNANDVTELPVDKRKGDKGRYKYAITEYVLKSASEELPAKFITSRFQFIKNDCNNKYLSITGVYKNGLINYIKERYTERGISLKVALLDEINNKLYTYDKDTQKYIEEFGSKMTTRMLRMEIKDFLDVIE